MKEKHSRPNYIHTQDVLYVMRTTSINTDNNTQAKRERQKDSRSLYFYREGRTNGRSYVRVHRGKKKRTTRLQQSCSYTVLQLLLHRSFLIDIIGNGCGLQQRATRDQHRLWISSSSFWGSLWLYESGPRGECVCHHVPDGGKQIKSLCVLWRRSRLCGRSLTNEPAATI